MKIPRVVVLLATAVLLAWVIIGNLVDLTPMVTISGHQHQGVYLLAYGVTLAACVMIVWLGAMQHLKREYHGSASRTAKWRAAMYVGFVFTAIVYVLLNMRSAGARSGPASLAA